MSALTAALNKLAAPPALSDQGLGRRVEGLLL
jgi:hypothetical protein